MFVKAILHFLVYAVVPRLHIVFSLFLLPYITAHLSPTDYAIYGLVIAYRGIFDGVKDLGFHVVLTDYFYRLPRGYQRFWRILFGYFLQWGLFCAVLLFGFMLFTTPITETSGRIELAALVTAQYILSFFTDFLPIRYFMLNQRPLAITVRVLATNVLSLGLQYYTIAVLGMGYKGWFIAFLVSAFVLLITYLHPVYIKGRFYPVFSGNFRRLKRYLVLSLPVVPHNYAFFLLYYSGRIVMDMLGASTTQIGLYSAAGVIPNYFLQIGDAMATAVSPFMLKMLYGKQGDENGKAFSAFTVLLQMGMLTVVFLTAVWMADIYPFLIRNAELQEGYHYGVILVMAFAFRPFLIAFQALMVSQNRTKDLMTVSLSGALLNLVLNLALFPFFGVEGICWATLIALIYVGYAGFFWNKLPVLMVSKPNLFLFASSNLFLAIVAYSFRAEDWVFRLWLSGVFVTCIFGYLFMNRSFFRKIFESTT